MSLLEIEISLCTQINYHQFVKYFKDTFQHGGVSLEEMVVPLAILDAK